MTCIVGLVDKNTVYIGSLGMSEADYSCVVRTDPKVFVNGDFLFGFTISFRMGQLLAYGFNPPKPTVGQDIMNFMVIDFVNAVLDCFKDHGLTETDGNEFLVGYCGRLFRIQEDYNVGEHV